MQMSEKKHPTTEEIENTMACSAFAEEGVPCPIGSGEKVGDAGKNGSSLDSVEDAFACTAFSDQNEECPISSDKKKE